MISAGCVPADGFIEYGTWSKRAEGSNRYHLDLHAEVARTAITDISLVGHLMRRAAFGARAAALEVCAARRYEDLVVDELLETERFPRLEEENFYSLEHRGVASIVDDIRSSWK